MSEQEVPFEESVKQQITISHQIQNTIKQAIEIVGNNNRYQVLITIIFSISFLFVYYFISGPSYFFMNPNFMCNGILTTEDQACLIIDQCIITNQYTITFANMLVCDRKDQRTTTQSMFGVGAVLGVVTVNFFSDFYSRKVCLLTGITFQIISVIFLLVGSWTDIAVLFYTSQLFAGFGSNSYMSVCYVYVDKIMSKKWAERAVLTANGIGVLSEMTLILFCQFFDWTTLAIYVIFIPYCLLAMAAVYVLVDDPILLFSKNKVEECKKSLATIAKWNGKENRLEECFAIVNELAQRGVQLERKQKSLRETIKYLRLVGQKRTLITIVCLGMHHLGATFAYSCINYSINEVGYSYGLTMLLFGIAQFLGIFPLMRYAEKLPRKKSIIIIVSIIIALFLLFLLDLNSVTQTILLAIIRFISISQYVMNVYIGVESFPQHIQSTAIGIIETIGQTSKVLAPLQIDLAHTLNLSPIALIGIMGIFIYLAPLFFIKQTLKPPKSGITQQYKDSVLLSEQQA